MMKMKLFHIDKIPAVLWGDSAAKVIIAVHGIMSSKTDIPIKILAEHAVQKGFQVLSFDLPEHGDRKNEGIPCKVQVCMKELSDIMAYVRTKWQHISLFANSIGAYFSLLSYHSEAIEKAWFLSPLVDMQRMIENMMTWFHITEEQLKNDQTISTPVGQILYWDYYCYVKEHPVCDWNIPTYILYGSSDDTCEFDTVSGFSEKFSCTLDIVQDGEHYFHTPEQMKAYKAWLEKYL